MSVAVDNDVIFKGASYGLLHEFIPTAVFGDRVVLGAARFVVLKRIARARLPKPDDAQDAARAFFAESAVVEPTDVEIVYAGRLERVAQDYGLNLDSGESLLIAVTLQRGLASLLTGDKRAIRSMEALLDHVDGLQGICGKVSCLEQLVRRVLAIETFEHLRAKICAVAKVDQALSICFSCTNHAATCDTAGEGLESHIASLKSEAPRVLA